MLEKKYKSFQNFLISVIPLSIIAGSSVSLINILILSILMMVFMIKNNTRYIFNNNEIKLIFIFYLYLIFNTFISLDPFSGLFRNLGFVRMIFLFLFINYFYLNNSDKFLKTWTIIISIFILDIYFERFFGTNIFGWGGEEPFAQRVVSFFKDEPVAGSFLSGFIFIIFGNLLKKYNSRKIYAILFLFLAFIALLFTGERSIFIKILIGSIIYLFFIRYPIKRKILFVVSFILIGIISINSSDYLKLRYYSQFFDKINSEEKIIKFTQESIYFNHYKSGYEVFKKYPWFGVGNKNYRVETCNPLEIEKNYICTTHPHQIYFEFLSEHGIVGTFILLGILFYLIFKILLNILKTRDEVQLGAFIYIIISFIPFLPSGSFFSDFNLTIFWINFSIMFACSKETNVFEKNR